MPSRKRESKGNYAQLKDAQFKGAQLGGQRLAPGSQRFPARVRLPAMHRGESPPQQSPGQCLKCPRCGWKWQRGVKQIPTPFPYCPANRECSWKKTQIEKKKLSRKPLSHILYLHFLRIHHDYFFRRAFQSVRAQFPSGNVSGNQSCL